jgi:ADP-ribose pyrophosphatase YjhB (NUDIX family)
MNEPRLAVGAVIVREGELLVIKRGKEPGAGQWAVPGGLVERGESLAEALRRELAEELGLTVTPGAIAWVGEVIGDEVHYVIVDLFASISGGEPASEAEEVLEWRWVPVRDLTSLPLVPTMHDLIGTIWPEL